MYFNFIKIKNIRSHKYEQHVKIRHSILSLIFYKSILITNLRGLLSMMDCVREI